MNVPHLEAELTKSDRPDLSFIPLQDGAGAGRIVMDDEQLQRAALRLTMRTRVGGRPETGRSDPGTDAALVADAYLELRRQGEERVLPEIEAKAYARADQIITETMGFGPGKRARTENDAAVLAKAFAMLWQRKTARLPVDMTKLRMHPSIQLASGRYFDFVNPETTPLAIEDIAAGLSRICRYTGQLDIDEDDIYSVAQHCVLASENCEPGHEYEALMHDRFEGVGNDMASPFKQLLPDYKLYEDRCEAETAKQYGVPHPMTTACKAIDMRMLATEKRDLMPKDNDGEFWAVIKNVAPLPFKITPWRPAESKHRFLHRYYWLRFGLLPAPTDKFSRPHPNAPEAWVDALREAWGVDPYEAGRLA